MIKKHIKLMHSQYLGQNVIHIFYLSKALNWLVELSTLILNDCVKLAIILISFGKTQTWIPLEMSALLLFLFQSGYPAQELIDHAVCRGDASTSKNKSSRLYQTITLEWWPFKVGCRNHIAFTKWNKYTVSMLLEKLGFLGANPNKPSETNVIILASYLFSALIG